MFFVSLVSPMEFDIEKFGYEEDEDSIEVGHVFGLVREEDIENYYVREGITKSHYRVKKNLGSKLEKIDFSQIDSGVIKLTYKDGDMCGTERYKAQILLICEVSERASGKLEPLSLNNDSTFY